MAILRWSPFSEIDHLRNEMNRMFNDYTRTSQENKYDFSGYPLVDIRETNDDFVIKAEVPGISKGDIKINVSENILTISGEKKQDEKEKGKNYLRTERSYGTFQRSFNLSTQIQSDKIKATYNDGVLTITVPKREEVKPKEIPITIE